MGRIIKDEEKAAQHKGADQLNKRSRRWSARRGFLLESKFKASTPPSEGPLQIGTRIPLNSKCHGKSLLEEASAVASNSPEVSERFYHDSRETLLQRHLFRESLRSGPVIKKGCKMEAI